MKRHPVSFISAAGIAIVIPVSAFSSVTWAQATSESQPAKQGDGKAEPTLDELLGLSKPTATPAPTAPADQKPTAKPEDQSTNDLNRKLSPESGGDEFAQAVDLMGDATRRLRQSADPGLATQRLQEEILKALDKMISDAEKQQSQQSQQSQSQQQQQQQQQNVSPQQRSQPAQANPSPEGGTPQIPRQDGPGRPRAGNLATWGNLPAHVRDALLEGISDRFSARYRQKTEEYYKRLAEDRAGGANR